MTAREKFPPRTEAMCGLQIIVPKSNASAWDARGSKREVGFTGKNG